MTHALEIKDEANIEIIEAFLYYEEKRTGLGEEFLEHLDTYFDRITENPKTLSTKEKTVSRSVYKTVSLLDHL